jgi:hypothetical protein
VNASLSVPAGMYFSDHAATMALMCDRPVQDNELDLSKFVALQNDRARPDVPNPRKSLIPPHDICSIVSQELLVLGHFIGMLFRVGR